MSLIPEDFEFLFVMPNLPKFSRSPCSRLRRCRRQRKGRDRPLPVPFIGFLVRVFYGPNVLEWREKWLHNGKDVSIKGALAMVPIGSSALWLTAVAARALAYDTDFV
jgi:hypothetical protein